MYFREWEASGFIDEPFQGLEMLDIQKIGSFCARIELSCQDSLSSPAFSRSEHRSEIDLVEVEAVVEYQAPDRSCPRGTVFIKGLLSTKFIRTK
jgi:hypothetical protein